MAAFRAAGHVVSGHKAGPDFIDPGYHALATGRPGRNLDPHLVGEDRVVPLLLHGAAGADVAVIEGVMGLYDGKLGTDGFASTAHVAALTAAPVVLVVDVGRQSRTAGAVAAGLAAFDDSVHVAGVILNRASPGRNTADISRAVERAGLAVLGALPPDERIAVPSRHLGLVPAAERGGSAAVIEYLGQQVAQHLDLDALLAVARQAPGLDAEPWDPGAEIRAAGGGGKPASGDGRPVIALAGGRAFTFRYAETEELLRAAGCEVVDFDPLSDPALPPGTRGLYLGGGFPEAYAPELAANQSLLRDLREAVAAGVPAVAECAGLLYLARALDGVPMAGVVPAEAAMSKRLTLRYPEAVAAGDSLLTRAGERVTGHEFHRTRTDPPAGATGPGTAANPGTATGPGPGPAWEIDGAPTGFATDTWHASYLHVHWAGHPFLAQRFADAVHGAALRTASASGTTLSSRASTARAPRPIYGSESAVHTPPAPSTALSSGAGTAAGAVPGPVARARNGDEAGAGERPADPLRHHGDAETGDGLLDFAVNVYAGARPAWLDRALHAAIDDSVAYPDVAPAREAVARCHGRGADEILVTAGAAEAFTLIARARPWRAPVVVHPQFTEPHAALEQAGHRVTTVLCRAGNGFALDPGTVPADADLVIIGNPTNPTGVLHPAALIRDLCRPGRLVVVDEAFMDAVPGESESLAREPRAGLVVIRSLTKHWSIPGIRAGYLTGDPAVVAELAAGQTPWSVSAPAIAATIACTSAEALAEARQRALALGRWRKHLEAGLRARDIAYVPAAASFVLACLGDGTRTALRANGIAVRRADTFPGLDGSWARIAIRPAELTDRLLAALDQIRLP
jgi:cobyrinic acid a,c-diamide synthase